VVCCYVNWIDFPVFYRSLWFWALGPPSFLSKHKLELGMCSALLLGRRSWAEASRSR
jgi:hypothetical protein